MALTYRALLGATMALAREVRAANEHHRRMATTLNDEARDCGRIAEQIAALKVDAATIAETREASRIMQGLSQTAIAYANAADEASRAATAAEQQTRTDHGGIQEAVMSSPVPMADRRWYTQE